MKTAGYLFIGVFTLAFASVGVPSGDPAMAAQSVNKKGIEREFKRWMDDKIWPEARAGGVTQATFKAALQGVSLDWSLPGLVPPGAPKRPQRAYSQAEFRSPGGYFKESRLNLLVKLGRTRLAKWRTTLDAIERRYGVPRRILVAIWGRESGYGRARIPHNAIRVLATEAFIGRRKALFRPELVAALKIIQQGHVPAAAMKSSRAGALGQPQFLPSKFLRYAVDFDGDGQRDIWRSVPDTLASIANYLREHGWQPGRDWGFESRIPGDVACSLEGPDKGATIGEWVRLGVKRVRGRPFPASEVKRKGYLLMPAGRSGPAYIATENFYVLKKFNESDLYALFVGHLADRYGTNRRFVGKWSAVQGFNRSDVQGMQKRLEQQGRDVGGADGLIGFRTRVAVGEWQAENGLQPTCFPDARLIRRIR